MNFGPEWWVKYKFTSVCLAPNNEHPYMGYGHMYIAAVAS